MHRSPPPRTRQQLDGVIRILLADALFVPTGLITAAFLTRQLGPVGYGLLSLVTTLITWAEWIFLSAFSRATIKFVGEADDWRPVGATAMRLQLIAGSCGALVLWLLAGPVAAVLREPALAGYLRLSAVGIPLVGLAAVHRQILIALGDFAHGARVSAARWIARLLLIVLLVGLGLSVPGAILGTMGASLVEVVVARAHVRPTLHGHSALSMRQLWEYAVPLFVFALSLRLFSNMDLLALKILGGTAAQAGLYGAAQRLSMLPAFLVQSLTPLLLSTLSRVQRDRGHPTAQEIGSDALRGVVGLLPFICVLAGAASEIVAFIFGPRFLPAAPLVSLLIFGVWARAMITVTTTILTAAGKPAWTSALAAPLVPGAIIGHLLLIPRLGATGAALVTTLLSVVAAAGGVWAVHRLWQIRPRTSTVLRSTLLCAPAYVMAAFWPATGALLLLKLAAIGLVIPLGFLALGEFSAAEIAAVRSYLNRRAFLQQKPGEV
jgi:O-antigen/teichoic acid export membrane protein